MLDLGCWQCGGGILESGLGCEVGRGNRGHDGSEVESMSGRCGVDILDFGFWGMDLDSWLLGRSGVGLSRWGGAGMEMLSGNWT